MSAAARLPLRGGDAEPLRIGVLALQGDYDAHVAALRRASANGGEPVAVSLVRRPRDLEGISGLVLPGGESTTMLKLLSTDGLDDAIVAFVRRGGAVLATCAGAILLSTEVANPAQRSLGVVPARIERNSYGRQVDSFVGCAETRGGGLGTMPLPAVFIRAPRFLSLGEGVETLATEGGDPVLVRHGRVLAATFHPELSGDDRVAGLFLRLCREPSVAPAQ